MRRYLNHESGAVWIAIGLIVLLADVCWSVVPIAAGMALITLGATLAVASRFRCSPLLPAVMVAHLFVYSALYLLFVGAVFHSAFAKPDGGMTLLLGVDLGLSIVPMAAAIRIALAAIAGDADVPAR